MTAWGPGDFSRPDWGIWSRTRHKLFRIGFWPFVLALVSGALYIIYRIWVWVLQ